MPHSRSFDRLLLLCVLCGFATGIGYGLFSHQAGLPLSLGEQLLQPLQLGDRTSFK